MTAITLTPIGHVHSPRSEAKDDFWGNVTSVIELDAALFKRFDTRFWETLREGLAFHRKLPSLPQAATGKTKRRPGENLLRRLHQFKDHVLRFLVDFDTPFTNNLGPNRRCA